MPWASRRPYGFWNKLEVRRFIERSPVTVSVGGRKYSLHQPKFAEVRDGIPREMKEVLEKGGRVFVKSPKPISTFGKRLYLVSSAGGKTIVSRPHDRKTWAGGEANKVLKRLGNWLAEEDYQPARLGGRVVENRFYVSPFLGRGTRVFASQGFVGQENTRSVSYGAADTRPAHEAVAELYQRPEYGGHPKEKALALASEWTEAARKLSEKVSLRLHRGESRRAFRETGKGTPFARASFQEKTPYTEEKGAIYLNYGWAVDLSPVWREKEKRFGVALSEVQVLPAIAGVFKKRPELEEKLAAAFRQKKFLAKKTPVAAKKLKAA